MGHFSFFFSFFIFPMASVDKGLLLYRSIRRLHRQLPKDLKDLGDLYVREEFRAILNTTNENQINSFFKQWENYQETLIAQQKQNQVSNANKYGVSLNDNQLDSLPNERKDRLSALKSNAEPNDENN